MKRFLFAGGGTGGHLYPALAIANALKTQEPDCEIAFMGTPDHLEAEKVPQAGFTFFAVESCGLKKTPTGAIKFSKTLLEAIARARGILKEWKPDCVVGTGGYVSAPALFAARTLGIPTCIQEQNAHPGLANRMLAPGAALVFTAFEGSLPHARLLGNPIRHLPTREESRAHWGLAEDERLLLVTGGSGGAMSINRAALEIAEGVLEQGWTILHVTGERNFPELEAPKHPNYRMIPYTDHMVEAICAADFVVSRAGALTLAEITALGRPALLVPYPYAGAHQAANAQELVRQGAAGMLADDQLSTLKEALLPLLDAQSREAMGKASQGLGRPNAAGDIAQNLLWLLDRDRSHTPSSPQRA